MLYISNCHWAYHSYNIMTWASFQRHKTSHNSPDRISEVQLSLRVPHYCLGCRLLEEEHLGGPICSSSSSQQWSSERKRILKQTLQNHDRLHSCSYLCKGQRLLIVEEEIMLLLLIVFPYWAPVQQLSHLRQSGW